MKKFLFNFITAPLGLPIDWYWEYLILAGVGVLAYGIAFSIVGIMYDKGLISGRGTGSVFHWLIRFVCFVFLWAFIYGIIKLVRWLIEYWVIILAVAGVLLMSAIIISITIKLLQKKRKA